MSDHLEPSPHPDAYKSPEQLANKYGLPYPYRKKRDVLKMALYVAMVTALVLCFFANMQCGAQT